MQVQLGGVLMTVWLPVLYMTDHAVVTLREGGNELSSSVFGCLQNLETVYDTIAATTPPLPAPTCLQWHWSLVQLPAGQVCTWCWGPVCSRLRLLVYNRVFGLTHYLTHSTVVSLYTIFHLLLSYNTRMQRF